MNIIEKTLAPDDFVYLNKFSNEKVIAFTDANSDIHFIHFGHKQESPLIGNHLVNDQNNNIISQDQVRVNINENTICLTPQNKNTDEALSFPFFTNPNNWERIKLDELVL